MEQQNESKYIQFGDIHILCIDREEATQWVEEKGSWVFRETSRAVFINDGYADEFPYLMQPMAVTFESATGPLHALFNVVQYSGMYLYVQYNNNNNTPSAIMTQDQLNSNLEDAVNHEEKIDDEIFDPPAGFGGYVIIDGYRIDYTNGLISNIREADDTEQRVRLQRLEDEDEDEVKNNE
jgi:hypothetical protein